jgi:thymidylate synthase
MKDMTDIVLNAAIEAKILDQQAMHDMAKAEMGDVNDEIADEMDEMTMMVTEEMTDQVDALIETVNNAFMERQAIVEAIETD